METMNWDVIVPTVSLVLGVLFGMWKASTKVEKAVQEGMDVLKEGVDLINKGVGAFMDDKKIDAQEWEMLKVEHAELKQEVKEFKEVVSSKE